MGTKLSKVSSKEKGRNGVKHLKYDEAKRKAQLDIGPTGLQPFYKQDTIFEANS